MLRMVVFHFCPYFTVPKLTFQPKKLEVFLWSPPPDPSAVILGWSISRHIAVCHIKKNSHFCTALALCPAAPNINHSLLMVFCFFFEKFQIHVFSFFQTKISAGYSLFAPQNDCFCPWIIFELCAKIFASSLPHVLAFSIRIPSELAANISRIAAVPWRCRLRAKDGDLQFLETCQYQGYLSKITHPSDPFSGKIMTWTLLCWSKTKSQVSLISFV